MGSPQAKYELQDRFSIQTVCRHCPVAAPSWYINRIMLRQTILCLGIVAFGAGAAHTELIALDSVKIEKLPQVQKANVSYTLDLFFSKGPAEYWTYYDTIHQSIVLDFYGTTIEPHSLVLARNTIFRSISVKNLKTDFALSNERSQIFIETDAGWHIETASVGATTMRLTVWRQLTHEGQNRNHIVWVYLLAFAIPIGVAVATFFIIRSAAS
jgi:hypothetical protein